MSPSKDHPRVVVVGSASAASVVVRILEAEADIVVAGQADTAADGVRCAVELRPDIVIVDLHLPDGGGLSAIEQIMARVPTPTLVLSRPTDDSRSPPVAAALVAGALDALPRPHRWTPALESQLRRSVRVLCKVHVMRHRPPGPQPSADAVENPGRTGRTGRHPVVAIAASTGGPSALAIVLAGLKGLTSPVLVVQHLHADFTQGFAEWMSRVSALPVEVAQHGAVPRSGRVYIAPSGTHLRISGDFHLTLDPTPETVHRPSADELFLSVAKHSAAAGTGVVLTGMGDDGARGLLAIQQSGGRTLAQDQASCAVFGMPGAAQQLGAVTEMLAPAELARALARVRRNVR